jgi:hypothetical protein
MLSKLGQAGVNAGNFVGSNPGMALGGAALGGLNLAGLGDGEDILMQLLAGAGGAGLGYAKGGVPGAVMGGLGGGVIGDLLPKLNRRGMEKNYNKVLEQYGEPSNDMLQILNNPEMLNEILNRSFNPNPNNR